MLKIVCVAYERPRALGLLVDSFLLQTCPDWELCVVYDGQSPQNIRSMMHSYTADSRITFVETKERNGYYGHPNRKWAIEQMPNSKDYLLNTNDDNYYVPKFVEFMLDQIKDDTGIVYCDTVHSHFGYSLNRSQLREGWIDMGAFIVRVDIAKRIGFNHTCFNADGMFAEDCSAYCRNNQLRSIYVPKPLFIHN
jgi:hypothetical protein